MFTADQLKELITNPDFQHLPQVLEKQDQPWWDLLDGVVTNATKLNIWIAAQSVALLFDTYDEVIESVQISVDTESHKTETYLSVMLNINDAHCYDGSEELDSETHDKMDGIDGEKAFELTVSEINDIGNGHLLSRIGLLQDAFEEPFFNSAKAREIAQKYAPEIDAWARQFLLERVAENTPRAKSPSAKM